MVINTVDKIDCINECFNIFTLNWEQKIKYPIPAGVLNGNEYGFCEDLVKK